LATGLVSWSGCHIEYDEGRDCRPGGEGCLSGVPTHGEATLQARTTYEDYEAATLSFTWATVADDERVLNDWDLLYGNDRHEDRDLFHVNMVTDDRSCIVDLGPVSFADVPETVDATECALPDGVEVALGHAYLVHTRDSNTQQWAVFRVVAHQVNQSVAVRWVRSPDPLRFVWPE
jgi:hypothetical protein